MFKFILLATIFCTVYSYEARSWTGRDWQSNSGGNWGGNGGKNEGGRNDEGGRGEEKWDEGRDEWAPAKYEFNYGIADPKTGDKKEQWEERVKDRVVGQYSLLEPDGTKRIVKYEADDKNGFNAKVIREGEAWHPEGRRDGKN